MVANGNGIISLYRPLSMMNRRDLHCLAYDDAWSKREQPICHGMTLFPSQSEKGGIGGTHDAI